LGYLRLFTRDEFEGSKIQYAFCRVLEPNSKLPKFILISWCGDGVPTSRKGLFNVHVNEVAQYFKGFHLHIQARHEEDVDPLNIMQKVKASSGAKYSIQSHVTNPSIAKPPQKPAVFKAPIAAPIKSAPTQAPVAYTAKQVDEPKPLYSPAMSSYEPVKTNPKPLNTQNAINSGKQNQPPPVQKKNISSISNRSQAFNSEPESNSSSGYQPIKLAPKPLYGEGVASKAFVPSTTSPTFGSNGSMSKPSYGSNTNLSNPSIGSNSYLSKPSFGSNTNVTKGSSSNVADPSSGSSGNLARKHSYTPSPRLSATNKQKEERIAEQRRQEERLAAQRALENEQSQPNNQHDGSEVLTLQQRMEKVRMRDQELAQTQRAEQEQREKEQELARAREHAARTLQKQQAQATPIQSYQPPQPVQSYQPPQPVQSYQPPQPVQTFQPVQSYQPQQPAQTYQSPVTQTGGAVAESDSQSATALYDYAPGRL
jgi:drebrin-like protein